MITGLLMIQALAAHALNPEEQQAIAERIKPVGEVCIEGQSCLASQVPESPAAEPAGSQNKALVAPVASTAQSETENNEGAVDLIAESYSKTCAICHAAGLADAPKFGSSEDWAPRIAKGKEVLYQSSIDGLPPAMPAKGMCFSCSDDDLKALVDYIVENSQ
jgi:cytochrome c5